MTVEVAGFDGTERCRTRLEEPDRYAELFRSLDPPGPCSIRGAGLSYALASACDGGTTVSMRHFDRILDFDPAQRSVTVEAGLTVGALHDFAVGAGCYFPVLPGHPSITVGGCAGFNVHGKTQHDVGHFADHVIAFTLYHPDHGEVRCTETDDGPLFALTARRHGPHRLHHRRDAPAPAARRRVGRPDRAPGAEPGRGGRAHALARRRRALLLERPQRPRRPVRSGRGLRGALRRRRPAVAGPLPPSPTEDPHHAAALERGDGARRERSLPAARTRSVRSGSARRTTPRSRSTGARRTTSASGPRASASTR